MPNFRHQGSIMKKKVQKVLDPLINNRDSNLLIVQLLLHLTNGIISGHQTLNIIAQYISLCNNIAYVGATLEDCTIYSLIFKNVTLYCTIRVTLCSLGGGLRNIPSVQYKVYKNENK